MSESLNVGQKDASTLHLEVILLPHTIIAGTHVGIGKAIWANFYTLQPADNNFRGMTYFHGSN